VAHRDFLGVKIMEQFNWAQDKINNLTETQQEERRKFQEAMRKEFQQVESNLSQYENRAQRREREKQERRSRSKSLAKL